MRLLPGSTIGLFATLSSILVMVYFVFAIWIEKPFDLGMMFEGGQKIPKETYPIIMLTIWATLQGMKSEWRPDEGGPGKFWYWEDKVTAYGMLIFMIATLVLCFSKSATLTFLIVVIAFLIQAILDALRSRRRGSRAGHALLDPSMTVAPVEREVLFRLKPRYVVVGPDGQDMDVDPRMITMVRNTPPT